MSHPGALATGRRPWRELGICAALGLLLLAFGVVQQVGSFRAVSEDWAALARSMSLRFAGTPLAAEVSWFVVKLLLLHLALGAACWLLAWATQRVFPALRWSRLQLSLGWFAVAVTWLLIGNATLFPWSSSGLRLPSLRQPIFAELRLFEVSSLVLLAAVACLSLRILALDARWRARLPRVLLYGALLLLAAAAVHWWREAQVVAGRSEGPPNIIIIGVDSLRPDVVGAGRPVGVTPNIDLFLRDGAHVFSDAITPLARTFPAWTAILSGRYPVTTRAREDLMGFDQLAKFPTLATALRERGYRTVLAIDETRFSNIDESFGFDQLITPPIGVADFLLGKANDFPLTNLLANTRLGKWLFPASHGNRAAAHVYRPETYLDRLRDELPRSEPLFLALHFTLPHYPYHWAEPDDEVFRPVTDKSYQYLNAMLAADAQVGALLQLLERRGALANAIVVLLSDHGEALGLPASDSLLRGRAARGILDGTQINTYGHGSSVLSPSQYAVVLGVRGYGRVLADTTPSTHAEPVSLVDVAPTLLDLAGIEAPPGFDGTSLRPLMQSAATESAPLADRIRFTETGFRTPLMNAPEYDERAILGATAAFFRMNAANGRFEVRPELMPVLLADKERAALSSKWLLASIPSANPELQKYVLVSRGGESARRIESAPDDSDAELARLWRALHEHYGAELKPPQPAGAR